PPASAPGEGSGFSASDPAGEFVVPVLPLAATGRRVPTAPRFAPGICPSAGLAGRARESPPSRRAPGAMVLSGILSAGRVSAVEEAGRAASGPGRAAPRTTEVVGPGSPTGARG